MNLKCPCCSDKTYSECCQPRHNFTQVANTPEDLMRSRYSAYALGRIDFIEHSMSGPALSQFNRQEAIDWSNSVKWLGLRIINAPTASSKSGLVEYTAFYSQNKIPHTLHEISEFRKENGEWKYVTGKII